MSDHPTAAPRSLVLTFVAFFTTTSAMAWLLAAHTGLAAFRMLGAVGCWAALVAAASLSRALPARLRQSLTVSAALAVVATPVWQMVAEHNRFAAATDDTLRLAAVAFGVTAFVAYFLSAYAISAARGASAVAVVVPFLRLSAAAHAIGSVALIVRLQAQRNWLHALEIGYAAALIVLFAEATLVAIARLYQPARLRNQAAEFGESVILRTLFGESGPLRSLAAASERTFGVRPAETWIVGLARNLAAPLLLAGVLGLWISTAFTRVPVDSRGVLAVRGEFQDADMAPGLHMHAPWPWARVHLVSTTRIHEVSLGFERDLAGPVLWSEKHFDGEQDLLVGEGQELLTFNVPLHYRIRDAGAYLTRTADAPAALQALGYRELLGITTTRSSFGLMTTERTEVAALLREKLQDACDTLGLGLEIVFVGLKDVHPPVSVAAAYQDVISAEEEQATIVEQARAYAVQSIAAAEVSAAQTRTQADAAATSHRTRAEGEAARFIAPLETYAAMPEVYTARLKLEACESALNEVRSILLVPPAANARRSFFLGVDPSALRR